jgi:ribonuclease D
VFDVYTFQKEDGLIAFFEKEVSEFLRRLMSDERKLKIFHDCRSDSLALHTYLNVCPKSVFDTASVHVFIE